MKRFYTVLLSLVILINITNKGFSQTVNVPYQFYLDANNNCNYDAGENLIYNFRAAINFTYVNASSSTVTVIDSTFGCAPFITITNPQIPPANGFSVSPAVSSS